MQLAVSHYRRETGRDFYALAGYHYSQPEWGFVYHPGGEVIHRWTTKIPPTATFVLLLLSLVSSLVLKRRAGWRSITGLIVVHVITAVIFALVVVWYDFNVTGIFI
jgi:hypothetical protein